MWIYANKKSALTCGRIDRMLGKGICIAQKGIVRLRNMGAISIIKHGRDMELKIVVPAFDVTNPAYEIPQTEKNPIIPFYEYNGERKIETCPMCKKKFIKIGNMKTCLNKDCRKQLELERNAK